MSKFRDKDKGTPGISTASLPDIVFMLLFFFMVATVLRETTLKVENRLPKATEMTKVQDKDVVSYIYIGKPLDKSSNADYIQLDDKFGTLEDIGTYVTSEVAELPAWKQPKFTVSLKVDRNAKTGLIYEVKEELRKANALRLLYATLKREEVY